MRPASEEALRNKLSVLSAWRGLNPNMVVVEWYKIASVRLQQLAQFVNARGWTHRYASLSCS